MGVQRLKDLGFGGYAGWGDTEAEADFAATGGTGKQSTGIGAQPDIQKFIQPFDIAGQERAGEEYLKQYGQAITDLPSPAATLEQYQQRYGVPQLQTQVQQLGEIAESLGAQFRGMPGVVAGTTRESLVTEPQRQRLVQSQQRPILEGLGEVTRGLATAQPALTAAQQQAGQLAGLEIGRQELSLLPFQRGFDLLEQRQAREFSGYTTANQLELDRLIANGDFGIRTQELALKEKGFQNELDKIRAEAEEERLTKKAPADLATLFSEVFG